MKASTVTHHRKTLALQPALASALCGLLLLCAIVASLAVGTVHLGVRDVLAGLLGREGATDATLIVRHLRLPRALSAALVGAGLSLAGLLYQGLFRNALADPFVLGASGGAAIGGATGILLLPGISFAGFGATTLFAFAGSLASMAAVYLASGWNRKISTTSLLLAGFAVGTILNAATSAIATFSQYAASRAQIVTAWLHGEVTTPMWPQLEAVAAIELAGILLSLPLLDALNTLALGEEYAQHLGINTGRLRLYVIVVASLVTACAVALGGLISFVGLLIPHLARLIFGPEHVHLFGVTVLGGALFLVLADSFARTVLAPTEIPVGILTAFLGGPVFLYLLAQKSAEVLS